MCAVTLPSLSFCWDIREVSGNPLKILNAYPTWNFILNNFFRRDQFHIPNNLRYIGLKLLTFEVYRDAMVKIVNLTPLNLSNHQNY